MNEKAYNPASYPIRCHVYNTLEVHVIKIESKLLKSFVEVGCLFSLVCHVSCCLCHLQY